MGRARWLPLLFFLPVAAAAPADVDLVADLPLLADGVHSTTSQGDLLMTGVDGEVQLWIREGAAATYVVHRAIGYLHPEDPEVGIVWTHKVERHALDPDALFAVVARAESFQFLARDATMTLEGPGAAFGSNTDPIFVRPADDAIHVRIDPVPLYSHRIDAGLLQARVVDGAVSALADEVFVTGATVTSADQQIVVGSTVETRPGLIYDPATGEWFGGGSHDEYVVSYLVFTTPRVDIRVADAPVWAYADDALLRLDGELRLPTAAGSVTVDGRTHHLDDEALLITGNVDLHIAAAAPDRASVRGNGDIVSLSYGTVAAEYPWATIAAVGFGAAIIALVAALAKGGFAVAGYARVHGPKILEHPTRAALYQRIQSDPGIGFSQLAEALALGDSTVQHHLRCLEKNGFVTALKDGRYLRYFDRHDGHYARERKIMASALRNPTTAAIARRIRERPGLAQCDLAAEFRLAASTVNWHIRRLSAVGLVDRRRDHPHTRYYAGTAWAGLPEEEHLRLAA